MICQACKDEGWVPAGHYEGGVELYDYDEECRDCPKCSHGHRIQDCEFCDTAPGRPNYQNTPRFTGDEAPHYESTEEIAQ